MKQIIVDNQVTSYFINETGKCFNSKTNKYLKGQISNSGYLNYNLSITPQYKKRLYAHRLVAQYFLNNGEPIEGNKEVNHKDGNKSNNNVDNLEWCTVYENTIHGFSLRKGKTLSHLSKDELLDVIDKYNNGWTSQSIVDFYELTIRNIESIKSLADGKNHYYKSAFILNDR